MRLRGLRESADLTQQQLADKATCHKQTIVKLERGEQEPAWPLVLALATALGVDCTAFEQIPDPDQPPAKVGRPRKAVDATPEAGQGTQAPEPTPAGAPGKIPSSKTVNEDQPGEKPARKKKGGKP